VPASGHGLEKAADPDAARDHTEPHLSAALEHWRREGLKVEGSVGDSDPLAAVQDAVNFGDFDEVIVSTLPVRASKWLKMDCRPGSSAPPASPSRTSRPSRRTDVRLEESGGVDPVIEQTCAECGAKADRGGGPSRARLRRPPTSARYTRSRTSRSRTRTSRRAESVPPTVLVLIGIGSVQFGSAIARSLFDDVGPGGTVMMRIVFAAVVLALLWRPSLRGHDRTEPASDRRLRLDPGRHELELLRVDRPDSARCRRSPASRGAAGRGGGRVAPGLDLVWVALAAGGILLLAAPSGSGLNAPGVILALVAGGWWAAYILLSARTGRTFRAGRVWRWRMIVASILILPVGIAQGGGDLLSAKVVGVGLAVALRLH